MRPTAILVNNKPGRAVQIMMVGGVEERDSIMYDEEANTWVTLPKLPEKHTLSCITCLNYKDQAIFTFMADGKFNIRSAVMPL